MLLMIPRYPLNGPLPIVIDFPTLISSSSVAPPPKDVEAPGLAADLNPRPVFFIFDATTTQLSAFYTAIPPVLSKSGLKTKM